MNPCQTVQQIEDSPAGSAPAVCRALAVLHPAHLLRGHRLHLYRVSPAACNLAPVSSQGAAGGAEPLAATAAALFGLSPDN